MIISKTSKVVPIGTELENKKYSGKKSFQSVLCDELNKVGIRQADFGKIQKNMNILPEDVWKNSCL